MTKRGRLIVFEGIDGAGSSTHVHKLSERLEEHNKYQDIFRTHEPWKNKEIKRRLEEDLETYSDGLEMAEIYVQDRTEHVRQLIKPNLKADVIVLCSRYKMSTCAYQWTQGVPLQDLLEMHENRALINPDLTFFLDVPREIAEERIRKTRLKQEKFERNPEFTNKLIQAYRTLVNISEMDKRIFGKVLRIDGNRPTEEVADEVFQEFLKVYSS